MLQIVQACKYVHALSTVISRGSYRRGVMIDIHEIQTHSKRSRDIRHLQHGNLCRFSSQVVILDFFLYFIADKYL
jgi:hypothetical protein